MKKNKRKDFKWFIKWIFIPILLFIFFILASYNYINKNLAITVLTYEHGSGEIITKNYSELLSGQKIRGKFVARDNNLGIVAVRFNTFFRINNDSVIFRIKNINDKKWFYEYEYTTPQFQPNQFFTFGFPIIPNSEGKIYEFEIESTKGQPENAVALSPIEPIFETKYQYSKEIILKNLKNPLKLLSSSKESNYTKDFLYRKVVNSFSNPNFLISFNVYALPLILYFTWLLFFNKYLLKKVNIILVPILIMIFIAITNYTRNDDVVLGIAIFWFVLSILYNLKTSISYLLAIIFILISIILYYFSNDTISKNFMMWGYMLLSVGVIQEIIQLRWEKDNQIDFYYLKKLFYGRNIFTKKIKH